MNKTHGDYKASFACIEPSFVYRMHADIMSCLPAVAEGGEQTTKTKTKNNSNKKDRLNNLLLKADKSWSQIGLKVIV